MEGSRRLLLLFIGLVVLVVPGSCVKLVSTFSTDFPFISIPPVYCALSGHTINLTCSFLASNAEKLSRIEWHLNNSLVHSWTLSEKSYFAGAWNLDSAAQDDKVFVHDESGASWGHSSVRVSHFDSSSNVTCAAFASSKVFRATVKFSECDVTPVQLITGRSKSCNDPYIVRVKTRKGVWNGLHYSPDVCVMAGGQRLACEDVSELENPMMTATCPVPANLYFGRELTISAQKWCNVSHVNTHTFRLSWGANNIKNSWMVSVLYIGVCLLTLSSLAVTFIFMKRLNARQGLLTKFVVILSAICASGTIVISLMYVHYNPPEGCHSEALFFAMLGFQSLQVGSIISMSVTVVRFPLGHTALHESSHRTSRKQNPRTNLRNSNRKNVRLPLDMNSWI